MTLRSDPKHILLVRTDRLGETLLHLPVAVALKQAFGRARVTWLANPALVELLQTALGVDQVLGYQASPAHWWRDAARLGRQWRADGVDLVLISNCTKEFHAASWLAGIPARVGYDRKWGCLLTHRLEDRRALGECHEVEYNMRLLTALGITVPRVPTLHLPVTQAAERRMSQLLDQLGVDQSERVVVVHPWTSNPRKQWPLERFHRLVELLSGTQGLRPVVIGGSEELAREAAVVEGLGVRVMNFVGRLSLPELAACLRRARVAVTNDSGPMHLAAAVGTPLIALFGTADPGSHPRRWGPWGSGHTVIHKPLEQITVEEVLAAAMRYVA